MTIYAERYRWMSQQMLSIESELSLMETYNFNRRDNCEDILLPSINEDGDYVMNVSNKEFGWLMKFTKEGLIIVNTRAWNKFPYQLFISYYIEILFGFCVETLYRYRKYRIYCYHPWTEWEWKEYHSTAAIRRYIYDIDQIEPIVFTMRGEIVLGATEYEQGLYKSKW